MIIDVAAAYQKPGSIDFSKYEGAIIQTSHGLTEEIGWRQQFNEAVSAGIGIGLYHFAELQDPRAQALFFHNLVGFLQPPQVYYGFWLDAEWGQDTAWADAFRSAVVLPWCGVYSNLAGFNGPLLGYFHFQLNWLAMPTGTVLPPGWGIPDHILLQTGQAFGIDVDVKQPNQPFPPAWSI